uniref:DUF3593 domain-containing protein n=1 Tax=Ananas comosus var. bracteatus TaxID=296719 RepID=A0A6V7PTQ9_ANACO|nr:unnamed protein product [Ananas comosus var. bracteatus]
MVLFTASGSPVPSPLFGNSFSMRTSLSYSVIMSRAKAQKNDPKLLLFLAVPLETPSSSSSTPGAHNRFSPNPLPQPSKALLRRRSGFSSSSSSSRSSSRLGVVVCGLLPVDPWAPSADSQSIASQLFAFSLFPYLGFLYFITKSNTSPKLTLFGFYFLLAFVGATTKVHYGTSLSNVDWLHGGAESLLTLTNLFIVLGLREAPRKMREAKASSSRAVSESKEKTSV